MATKEQVKTIIDLFHKTRPTNFFSKMTEINAGIGAVLQFLVKSEGSVTAGQISDKLQVSTARVAVLLKKMVAKNLIEKSNDPKDARITVVVLTDHGRETVRKIRLHMETQINTIIDTIGFEKLVEFADTLDKMQTIIGVPPSDF